MSEFVPGLLPRRAAAPDFVPAFGRGPAFAVAPRPGDAVRVAEAPGAAAAAAGPDGGALMELAAPAPAADGAGEATTMPRPRHFRPADPDANPTAGWDPFRAAATAGSAAAAGDATADAGAVLAAAAPADPATDAAARAALAARIADAFAAGRQIDRAALAEQLRATVLHLVEQMLGEAAVDPERLGARIAAATALLGEAPVGAVTIRLHPAECDAVAPLLPAGVAACADATVERGGFVLENAVTRIEEGPGAWLDQLRAATAGVPVPSC